MTAQKSKSQIKEKDAPATFVSLEVSKDQIAKRWLKLSSEITNRPERRVKLPNGTFKRDQ